MGREKKKITEKTVAESTPKDETTLSPRELELFALLEKGHSYKEISLLLFISEGTVKQHAHKIYGKLEAKNRTQAINNYRERKNNP